MIVSMNYTLCGISFVLFNIKTHFYPNFILTEYTFQVKTTQLICRYILSSRISCGFQCLQCYVLPAPYFLLKSSSLLYGVWIIKL